MSPRSDIPEPWRTAMEDAGLYSSRALAEKTGIATTTVTGLVYGRRQSDEQTIKAVADALRLEVTTIRSWASQALGELEPFELPQEANQLNRKQRDAVLTVVRAMLEPGDTPEQAPNLAEVEGLLLAEEVDAPAPTRRDG